MPSPTKAPNALQLNLIKDQVNPRQVFRDIRNYLAGQFIGSTRDSALLDEVVKLLFYKMYVEFGYVVAYTGEKDSVSLAKHVRKVFSNVRKDFPEIFAKDAEILLDPESISIALDLFSFDMLDAVSDPVGDAFEVFIGSESKSRSGQFFTPKSVTDLLVRAIDPKPNELIIDPACGAGGFLASTARYLAMKNKRFPLEDTSTKLYGIDKDNYLVDLARIHISLLTGGHPHLINADSLALKTADGLDLQSLPKEGFDVLMTNPPFGARIVSANAQTMQKFELARKWKIDPTSERWMPTNEIRGQVPPQILFVERCLNLLKDGGRMGIVLPESLVSNKSHRFVVQYMMENARILAVMGMPEALFKTSGKGGTHTKTCLIIAQKDRSQSRRAASVFMAEAKWCGHDSRARSIPLNDLPTISENFTVWKHTKKLADSPLGFVLNEEDIKDYVLCPHYYDPKIEQELKKLAKSHDLVKLADLVAAGILTVSTGDELGKLAYGTGEVPFVRTSDLSNWEIKIDSKHGVDRKIFDRFKRKQDVKPWDILVVKDGTYLIGTCAIVTPQESEIVFQSHIYKIRVNKNDRGITPFFLLATLSSPIVQRQIKAKQFTMDIIDSLGDRLYELVLPIPKSGKKRKKIDTLVRKAIDARIEARALIHEAREAVGGYNGSNFALRNSG